MSHAATLVIDHDSPGVSRRKVIRVADDEAVLLGRAPKLGSALFEEVPADRRRRIVTLPVASGRTPVSRAHVVVWASSGQVLAGVAIGAQAVLAQPWGHQAQSTALSRLPGGEVVDVATTLWLPWSSVDLGRRGGRWRMGLIPAAQRTAGARSTGETFHAGPAPPLTGDRLDAVVRRFAPYLTFPAAVTAPAPIPYAKQPGHLRKAIEHRLDGVRDDLVATHRLDRLGHGHELLALLLGDHALTPQTVALAPACDFELVDELVSIDVPDQERPAADSDVA